MKKSDTISKPKDKKPFFKYKTRQMYKVPLNIYSQENVEIKTVTIKKVFSSYVDSDNAFYNPKAFLDDNGNTAYLEKNGNPLHILYLRKKDAEDYIERIHLTNAFLIMDLNALSIEQLRIIADTIMNPVKSNVLLLSGPCEDKVTSDKQEGSEEEIK